MERLLLSLAIFLISTSAAQAQFTGCFADNCTTLVVGGPSSNAEDCCVNNNAGLYYNQGGQCFQCIVYGFGLDNFTRAEAQFPYDFPFGYFKGPSNAQLRMAIDYNGEGTALEGEFGIGQSVVSLPLNPGGTTSITFQADRVALEPDETFVLELALLNVANVNRVLFASSLPNVFFRSRQEFIIQDSTALVFRLRESDRVVDEGDASIPIEVTVANEVELASDISLVLTPMIAPEDFTPLPTTRPLARANTFEGRIDFFTTPITLNFVAGGEILLAGDVLIYNDTIDEALEYFVVNLTFQDPDNVPPLASIERDGGDIIRIDIIDDDDIFIGFALPNTTYPEVEADHRVQIIKGAGNVTEQIISFVVNLFLTAPPGLGNAIPSADGEDNDFFIKPSSVLPIGPEETETFVTGLNIFADDLPEVTEAAQLRLSLPTETGRMFPGFETLPQYPTFFIIIEDDDPFRIGFENTSYIVNEGIGFLEVCVRIFEPLQNKSLGRLTVDLGVETVRGSADGNDYTEMTGARNAFFLFFSNTSRRSCIMVEIEEDTRYEFQEQFSLRFIELQGTSLPDTLILDPPRSNITIVDNEEVTVGFINPPYSAREDKGPMIFTVGVTSGHTLNRDIELSFSTVDSLIANFAAMAGLDYTSIINMPIILSAGMQSIDISVELNPDQIFENNEVFQGILTIISGERVSLSPGTANATIIEDEVVCQELELLVNGRIEYLPDTTAPYLEGTIAEHICFPGFVLIGNVMRICQNDSTFSGVSPTCQPIECPPLDGIENGVITYAADITPNYTLSTVATYDCDTGYFLDLSLGGSEMRTCVNDDGLDAIGEFDNQAPICILVECPPLDPITNGFITYAPDTTSNYDLGTVATYDCDAGFVLDLSQGGSMTRTCFDDLDNDAEGLFSGQAPACIPIECLPLGQVTNGMITYAPDTMSNYDLGTVATYTCNDGYRLDITQGGSETRTCIDDLNGDAVGVFTNLPPRCVLINVVRVNDTVIGDPLMTVPLYVQNKSAIMPLGEDDLIHLCFEVHGSSDAYFNLVSDDCVSVNAHYQQIAAGKDINIVDDISVRAVASDGSCHNIEVLLDQCTARVDGVVINNTYSMNDIMVRKYPSRVRIAVPNCGSARGLVMWVMCQRQTFWSASRTNADGTEFTFQADAIRFVVARGLNLREESHGILGQFWNIPIQVVPYNGPFTEPQVENDVATFSVIINSPGDSPRQFIAWLRFPSWEYERRMYCLYAGDGHAGSVYEVPAGPANGPVIEGIYTDYIVSGQFETDFEYNQFDSNMCL